jgi:hypothetical protein
MLLKICCTSVAGLQNKSKTNAVSANKIYFLINVLNHFEYFCPYTS